VSHASQNVATQTIVSRTPSAHPLAELPRAPAPSKVVAIGRGKIEIPPDHIFAPYSAPLLTFRPQGVPERSTSQSAAQRVVEPRPMRVMEHQAGRFRLYAAKEGGVLNMVQTSLPSQRLARSPHLRRSVADRQASIDFYDSNAMSLDRNVGTPITDEFHDLLILLADLNRALDGFVRDILVML
jgi:hypothetical protein